MHFFSPLSNHIGKLVYTIRNFHFGYNKHRTGYKPRLASVHLCIIENDKQSNMNKKKAEGLEITTFKLNGYTCAEFIEANADVDEWLQHQPGFQSRRIAEQPDGTIVDMLVWDAVSDGRKAMTRLMNELSDSPVHTMIDQGTVSWNVWPILHNI